MKRRTFGLLSGCSLVALLANKAKAQAQTSNAAAAQLGGGKLTPVGAEVAGNADGSIPAWTGGLTAVPSGTQVYGTYVQHLFPGEKPLAVVDKTNMDQHSAFLSEAVKAMMTKYGFSIKVYPTHRTAAAPQWVYDNTKANAGSAKFGSSDPGGRFGFSGAYGGIPFPIPDVSNPLTAGAQIIWNHQCNWRGFSYTCNAAGYVVNGGAPVVSFTGAQKYRQPYWDPKGNIDNFDGKLQMLFTEFTGPADTVGQEQLIWHYINNLQHQNEAWQLLAGQGRVRRAPEVAYDTPSGSADGLAQYDEYNGFNGAMDRYDWKFIEKKEMYIPYNNNELYGATPDEAHKPYFLNPDLVRWEKHRCWVVEATLHSGERNVLAKRVFYVDEDTWAIGVADEYDGNLNLFKGNFLYNYCDPALPGLVLGQNTINNLQTDNYATIVGPWDCIKHPEKIYTFVTNPLLSFEPNRMAATAQY